METRERILEGTIAAFDQKGLKFQRGVLIQNQISYVDALNEVVKILVDGILVKQEG